MNPKKELITMGPMGNPDTAKPSNSEASTANRAEEPATTTGEPETKSQLKASP